MALDATVRAAVAQALLTMKDLFVTVTHEAKTGTDADGKPTYATGVARQGFLMTQQSKLARFIGSEAVQGPSVFFLENVPIKIDDRLTFPDTTSGSVSGIESVADPNGGIYYAHVRCGTQKRPAD